MVCCGDEYCSPFWPRMAAYSGFPDSPWSELLAKCKKDGLECRHSIGPQRKPVFCACGAHSTNWQATRVLVRPFPQTRDTRGALRLWDGHRAPSDGCGEGLLADPQAGHACMHAQRAQVGRGERGGETRISDALWVSTDTMWVLRTVYAPRMTHSCGAVVVLGGGCSSGAASHDSDVHLQYRCNLNQFNDVR